MDQNPNQFHSILGYFNVFYILLYRLLLPTINNGSPNGLLIPIPPTPINLITNLSINNPNPTILLVF